MERRQFLSISTYMVLGLRAPRKPEQPRSSMYGIIGKIIAVEGSRDALATVLLNGIGGMPGCMSYVVANDSEDADALWVTEVWESETAHEKSLSLPSVQQAIREGRPMIAGFGERYVTTPLGGHGLDRR